MIMYRGSRWVPEDYLQHHLACHLNSGWRIGLDPHHRTLFRKHLEWTIDRCRKMKGPALELILDQEDRVDPEDQEDQEDREDPEVVWILADVGK